MSTVYSEWNGMSKSHLEGHRANFLVVVVPKCSADVRICVSLKALNKHVKRETRPIPTVDSVLAQLSDAAVFSKLDANSDSVVCLMDVTS